MFYVTGISVFRHYTQRVNSVEQDRLTVSTHTDWDLNSMIFVIFHGIDLYICVVIVCAIYVATI